MASVLTLALLGLFLAVQPWSVLAAVLLVTTPNGVTKELAYVAGWVSVLTALAIVTVVAYPSVPQSSAASTSRAVVELVAGLVFGWWLLNRWRHPKDVGTAGSPSWMGRLDTMKPIPAFGLGAFLPSYAVVIAAISELLGTGLPQGWLLLVAILWVLLASTGVASPLMVLVTDREHASATYTRWRQWIVAHSRAVLYAVGGLVCVVLIGKGIIGLVD